MCWTEGETRGTSERAAQRSPTTKRSVGGLPEPRCDPCGWHTVQTAARNASAAACFLFEEWLRTNSREQKEEKRCEVLCIFIMHDVCTPHTHSLFPQPASSTGQHLQPEDSLSAPTILFLLRRLRALAEAAPAAQLPSSPGHVPSPELRHTPAAVPSPEEQTSDHPRDSDGRRTSRHNYNGVAQMRRTEGH